MPTGLQEPKKGGFQISLATDLYLSFSPLNDPKISKKSEKLFPQKSLIQKSRESKHIFHGSRKSLKPVSRGRKNIDSRFTEKINPHSVMEKLVSFCARRIGAKDGIRIGGLVDNSRESVKRAVSTTETTDLG